MKKSILTLLILFICAIQSTTAYEYFTIYFSDGTKSEAFYATDVDSICYSKLSLDSIAYEDWQVQEIYTCDSVYRYPLVQIDSLSFKDVDVNKVAEDIANAVEKIAPILNSSLNIDISSILKIEGVEDAYISNQALFIKIRDWGCFSFNFPLEDYIDDEIALPINTRGILSQPQSSRANTNTYITPLKACIVNQQFLDNNRKSFIGIADSLDRAFIKMNINSRIENTPSPNFFRNEMFDYDILFIKTHGDYDEKSKLHWLCTSEELWSYNPLKTNPGEIKKWLKANLRSLFIHKQSTRKISVMCIGERRGNDTLNVFYTSISDEYIMSAAKTFRNKGAAIVFNTACESMMNNYNMARAFQNRGAGVYLGYTDSNGIGANAGSYFFYYLMACRSVTTAFHAIPAKYHEQKVWVDENGTKYFDAKPTDKETKLLYHPKLKPYPENSTLRIIIPETLSSEVYSADGNSFIRLEGGIKIYPLKNVLQGLKFGFEVSANPDMSDPMPPFLVNGSGMSYQQDSLFLYFETILESNESKPNTTYYYRAYMSDSYSNCYGEIKSFTTKEVEEDTSDYEAYFVLNDNNTTLTFYFDNKCAERKGHKESLYFYHDMVENIILDSSFAKYHPKKFSFNDCTKLISIAGLQYLNTSDISDMSWMFKNCQSLTSLDLSSFNTSNVTDMSYMFSGCSSLTSIDLSSFNTTNVTDMYDMFRNCSSLTSIDLSNFNTANVSNMSGMFCHCSSLASLNLSAFNTAKASGLSEMFRNCKSLTTLDLHSFEMAPNSPNTYLMFHDCSLLRTIYVSSDWECNSYGSMFGGCNNLEGGKGTRIGDNVYYDENGKKRTYHCSDTSYYARIDGGKDNPGLFTAK